MGIGVLSNLKAKDMAGGVIDQKTARHIARAVNRIKSTVRVAATGTEVHAIRGGGRITGVRVMLAGAVPAAGESMTIDVAVDGTSVLTGGTPITINNSSLANVFVEGVLKTDTTPVLSRGEVVTIVRTYVAGGGPTPMTDTYVEVDVSYDD